MLPKSAPDLAALDLFVSVVDCGSLSRAAARHYISQPSASARIAQLERRLGLKLLDRTPSGSVPTAVGQVLADRARVVLQSANDLCRAADALSHTAGTRLRVVASYTMGDYVLPRWLHVLGSSLPEISVTVRNSADTVRDILDGAAELGFMCIRQFDAPLESLPVGRDRLVVVAHPSHHWVKRLRPIKPEHLAAERLVVREEQSGTRSRLYELLEEYRPQPAPVPMLELGSTSAVKAAVLDGVAPAVLSEMTVADELHAGRLVEVPVAGLSLDRTLYAIWRSGHRLSDEARTLLDFAGSDTARTMIPLLGPPEPANAALSWQRP
jgi:DNA-binding transcriptional LysR family regulator